MSADVTGGHLPRRKKDRASAHAQPWKPAVSRRLGAAGITMAVLGVAACSAG